METVRLDSYEPYTTAINRVGYTVNGIERRGKKIVITVSRRAERGETENRDRAAADTGETAT
jgi:hypothetical protein